MNFVKLDIFVLDIFVLDIGFLDIFVIGFDWGGHRKLDIFVMAREKDSQLVAMALYIFRHSKVILM